MTTSEIKKEMQIGDVLDDKTIYAGEVNGKKIFAAPQDAKKANGKSLMMTFNGAADHAKKLNQENYLGHNDWRVPTIKELYVLSKNCNEGALKGTFNVKGSFFLGMPWDYYWSSEPDSMNAFGRRIDGGDLYSFEQYDRSRVRLVR